MVDLLPYRRIYVYWHKRIRTTIYSRIGHSKRRVTGGNIIVLERFHGTVNNLLVLTYGHLRGMVIFPLLLLTTRAKPWPRRYTHADVPAALFVSFSVSGCSPSKHQSAIYAL